jgi:DNA recombination-dependent growth factor C
MGVDAPSRTEAADLARLRERLDDLGRRRVAVLERPAVMLNTWERRQLEAMRFELAEVEWHLAQLESN